MDENEMAYAENLIQEKGIEKLNIDMPEIVPARNYYALSCTTYSDSYFHFNNYADCCSGVSIGISRNFIKESMGSDIATMIGYHLYFADLIYDENTQIAMIENYLRNTSSVTRAYNNLLAIIKRSEFKLESEVRLIYRQDFGGLKTIGIKISDKKYFDLNKFLLDIGLEKSIQDGKQDRYKHAIIGSQERKYYEMSIKEFDLNNVFKRIIIGPTSNQDEKSLNDYLKSKNINAEVIKSKIKLRNCLQ